MTSHHGPSAPAAFLHALPVLAALASPLQPPVGAPFAADAAGLGRVAVIGDAGTRGRGQRAVARAMSAEHARAPFASVLVLGDNVYEHGEPEWFDAAISEPYAPLFAKGVRFFPVMGNHDVRARLGEAQRAYWGAPRWYKMTIGPADFFAVDTTVLLPRHQKGAYEGALSTASRLAREQLDWLDAELSRSKAAHRIVYGHHPLYVTTAQPAKVAEAGRMRAILEETLRKHGVSLYLSGHEHHYERSEPVGGVVHLISGAGGKRSWWPLFFSSGVSKKLVRSRHFLMLELFAESVRARAVDEEGAVFDEFVLRPSATRGETPR